MHCGALHHIEMSVQLRTPVLLTPLRKKADQAKPAGPEIDHAGSESSTILSESQIWHGIQHFELLCESTQTLH